MDFKEILDREMESIDFSKLDEEQRRVLSGDARAALSNRALAHIIGKTRVGFSEECSGVVVQDMVENIARYAESFEDVQLMRAKIVAIEYVREILLAMLRSDPNAEPVREPNAPI